MLRRQITIIGSWTFSTVGQADCARFIADRGIDVDRLFTDRWKLEQAAEAYKVFRRPAERQRRVPDVALSSRHLLPGSIHQLARASVDCWIPVTSTGMTRCARPP